MLVKRLNKYKTWQQKCQYQNKKRKNNVKNRQKHNDNYIKNLQLTSGTKERTIKLQQRKRLRKRLKQQDAQQKVEDQK